MSKQEVGKDELFDKDRELIAIFCKDTTLKFEFLQIIFKDGKIVTPQIIIKTGDFGLGKGVYNFLEPKVMIPAKSEYNANFRVAPECQGKEYDFKIFQKEIKPAAEEEVVLDN